jgi:hypothetical protein
MTKFAWLALASLLALAAGGMARADDAQKAKIGVLRLSSSAPVFIAQDKGYFREAGLDIELKFFDAAQPIAVATTSGDVDFGITAFTAGLYNLAGKGTLKVIGGMSREKAGYPLIGYFASNNAYAAGLKTPKDLAGKRIGTPLYTQTAAVIIRGMLQDEYGGDFAGCHWVQGATNSAGSHGAPVPPAQLPGLSIELNASGRSLSDLLASGEIQAIIGSGLPDSLKSSPDVVRLFPDYHAVEMQSYRRTRVFPVMHLVALRRDTYERNPFIARSLFDAMTEAKNIALKKMRDLGTLRYMLPGMAAELDEIDDVFDGDPWPYGIEPNRPTLEALVRYLSEQSMIKTRIPLEELFVPV